MTGEVHREHWIVPVHGLAPVDAEGRIEAAAHRDGTVILRLTCGHCRTIVRLDVSRAAQLSTAVWEAAGIAQHLTTTACPGDERVSPPQPSHPPEEGTSPPRSYRTTRRRRLPAVNTNGAAVDATRTMGQTIRRLRQGRNQSLRVISGLAGMSASTLHRIERGQRELTLSEIVALSCALQVVPTKLINLMILGTGNPSTPTPSHPPHRDRPSTGC